VRASTTEVRVLTREALEECLGQLVEIDRDTIGEPWTEPHFRLDLPEKWDHSAVLVDEGVVQGFAIVSRKPGSLHVHRIAVARESRGMGYGPLLLAHVAVCAAREGVPNVTLRVSTANSGAVRFYNRLGFRRDSEAGKLLDLSISAGDLGVACATLER
jgi:ribosomal protein S18 acetylase RimI-like enzyme